MKRLLALTFFLMVTQFAVAANDGKSVVAFAQDTMANDFRRNQVAEVKVALDAHPDVSFVQSDANGSTALLISQIENFTRQKVDVLILGTGDATAVVPAVDHALAAGVKVIILDRGINSDRYTSFVNSDNQQIGQIGADYIIEKLGGKGRVLLFEGIQTADVTQLRTQGFMDRVSQYPEIKVIKRTGNYLRKDALIEMDKFLASGERVDAIFSESDSMLSGVRMVLPKYGIDPSSLVMIGCDFVTEAKMAIMSGTQTGSVKFPLGGSEAAQIALDLIAGREVPKHVSIPVRLITPENVAEATPVF